MHRRGIAVGWIFVAGCGARATPILSASTGDAATVTTEVEDPGGPSSSTGIGSTATTSTITSDGGESNDDTKFDVPALDVPPHDVEHCVDGGVVDLDVVTPTGEFAAMHAWWAWEACCVVDPWLVLTEASTLDVVDGVVTTPHLVVFVPGEWQRPGPYLGARDVRLTEGGLGELSDLVAGFELLEPLDPLASPDVPPPNFVGTFAVDAAGWTITGTVDAPYCAAFETPSCPCE